MSNQTIEGVPLLPCPFCGSAPIEQQWLPEGCGTGDVVCSNDDCAIGGIDGIPYEQWNKRPGQIGAQVSGAFTIFPGDIQSIGSEGMVIADSTGTKVVTADWCETCDKVTPHEKRCQGCKQAAQPQGEPVARIDGMYGDPEAFAGREIRALCDVNKLKIGTLLYAGQPAPVAVVLPERMKEPDWDDFKPDSQAHEAACEGAKKFNECIDEVISLNTK